MLPTNHINTGDRNDRKESLPINGNDWDNADIIKYVEASPAFDASDSPERLARVPGVPNGFYRLLFIPAFPLFFSGFGLLLVAVRNPIFFSFFPTIDPTFSAFLGFLFLGLFLGLVVCLYVFRGSIVRRLDRTPIKSRAVVVVRPPRNSPTSSVYFVDGRNTPYWLPLHEELTKRLCVGDAGVLFVRARGQTTDAWPSPHLHETAVDFDCVLTAESLREPHLLGAVLCPSCESVYKLGAVPSNCLNCGSALPSGESGSALDLGYVFTWRDRRHERRLLNERMIHAVPRPTLKDRVEDHVTCGWCRTRHESRPDNPSCTTCGGVLPMPPGDDPGSRPPAPPRQVPWRFVRGLYFGRYWTRFENPGQLAVVVLLVGIFFPILYFFVLFAIVQEFLASRRRHLAYTRGVPILGLIERVERIGPSASLNSTDYYRILYRFEANGQVVRGMCDSHDEAIAQHFPGERIWIVYVPRNPHKNAIWPPFA